MRKKLIGIILLIAMGILTACSQEGSSTVITEAVTENTTDSQLEANTTEQIKTTRV
jgi:galactitol-specific phosphotransferase system IIB component